MFLLCKLMFLFSRERRLAMDLTRQPDISLTGGPHGIPPDVVRDVQRGRVLAATLAVVGEQGFRAASVSSILARAHVSRRTFYELFEDREDCFLQTYEETSEQLLEVVARACRQAQPGRGADAGLRALLGLLADEPAVARICVIEALAAGPAAATRRAHVMDQLAVMLAGQLGERGRMRARLLVGGVHELVHDRLHAGAGLRTLADELLESGWLTADESPTGVPNGEPR